MKDTLENRIPKREYRIDRREGRILNMFVKKHSMVADKIADHTITREDVERMIESGIRAGTRIENYRRRDVFRKILMLWGMVMSNNGWGFPDINIDRPEKK